MVGIDYKVGLFKFILGYDLVKGLNLRVIFDSLV